MKHPHSLLTLLSLLSLSALFSSCTKDSLPSEEQLKSDILGKWITVSIDGQRCLTDEERVVTYTNDTYSLRSYSERSLKFRWKNKTQFVYSVTGNVITEYASRQGSSSTIEHTFVSDVKSISRYEMNIAQNHKVIRGGDVITDNNSSICFQRVDVDQSIAILGLWEGISTSDNTYGDANHRWEYKNDGTYIYYSKDDKGAWVKSDNLYNEYFVDGYLLATRWIDKDNVENREWWNIKTCNEEKMEWEAIRERADGTQYTHTFVMKRVK